MPAKNIKLDQFESQLAELESIVRDLESGDTSLEKAVSHFEKGMKLSKQCNDLLAQAELKVEKASGADNSSNDLQDK